MNVVVIVLIVMSVVVMANDLSREYFVRWHWSERTRIKLAPLTVHFLSSLTNEVKVWVYYDKEDPLYSTVRDLLNEYQLRNPKVVVHTVDYLRDAGVAQKVKNEYKLNSPTDKNVIIFDCEGRVKTVQGDALSRYAIEQTPEQKPHAQATSFEGERAFTSMLLAVTSPKALNAYFVTDHGERSLSNGEDFRGYLTFASLLKLNYVKPEPLSLLGTNGVPADCNLLVVAGPVQEIPASELAKMDHYLIGGGRMLALLDSSSVDKVTGLPRTGLEALLGKWGLQVGTVPVTDPPNDFENVGLVVKDFAKHPMVNPLVANDSDIFLVKPLPVGKLVGRSQAADAPKVEEIAFSSPSAYTSNFTSNTRQAGKLPLLAVVDGTISGVTTERGATRILAVGDSYFLANKTIDSRANRDFAQYAVNWLLDRPQLLEEIGPHALTSYRVLITRSQLQAAEWLMLAVMPGGVLVLGLLVWFRRRR